MRYSTQSMQMVCISFLSLFCHSYIEVCVFILHTGSGASVTVVKTVNITMAEVTGLTPFSQYTFYVISENAVSSQARDTGGRSSSTSATTPEGGERV